MWSGSAYDIVMLLRTALAILCPLVGAVAQDWTLKPRLRAGDVFQLEITQIRSSPKAPAPQQRASTATVTVLRADEKGTLLTWSADNAAAEFASHPALAPVAKLLADVRLQCELGPEGEFLGFRNREELTALMSKTISAVLTHLEANTSDPEVQKNASAAVRQMLTPETAILMLSRGPGTYFAVNGKTIAPGKPFKTDVEYPTPFGGLVKGTFELRLEKADSATASLTSDTTFEPVALDALLGGAMAAAGVPAPTEEEQAQLPKFEMADSGRYTYDLRLGIAQTVETTRSMKVGSTMEMTESWNFRLTEEPTR